MTTLVITIEGEKDDLEFHRSRLMATIEEFVSEEASDKFTVDWEWDD